MSNYFPTPDEFGRLRAPVARERLSRALGNSEAAEALRQLARASGVTRGLEALGLRREFIGRVAELATATPYPNPRGATKAEIEALLEDAFVG